MLNFGGWVLYLFAAGFFLLVIIWVIRRTIGYWGKVIRLYIAGRRNGLVFLPSASQMGLGLTMFPVLGLLIWFYVSMVVLQMVQVVRFDNQQIELVYRWPWLNHKIPYHSITSVRLKDAPSRFAIPGIRPKDGFPVEIVITTSNGAYVIGPQPPELRNRIILIYSEIEKHSREFATN